VCFLVVQNVREGAFSPPSLGSWDHETEPIQGFQTVSTRTPLNRASTEYRLQYAACAGEWLCSRMPR
jgi:hypothetical protein